MFKMKEIPMIIPTATLQAVLAGIKLTPEAVLSVMNISMTTQSHKNSAGIPDKNGGSIENITLNTARRSLTTPLIVCPT